MKIYVNIPDFFDKGEPPCASADPDAFFPEKGESNMIRNAKMVCSSCQYQTECLDYAINNNEIGIWGGTTEYERRQLKRGIKIRQPRKQYSGAKRS